MKKRLVAVPIILAGIFCLFTPWYVILASVLGSLFVMAVGIGLSWFFEGRNLETRDE